MNLAFRILTVFDGRVYRGIDFKIDPILYAVNTTVTWQQLTSTTKAPTQTLSFLFSFFLD